MESQPGREVVQAGRLDRARTGRRLGNLSGLGEGAGEGAKQDEHRQQ